MENVEGALGRYTSYKLCGPGAGWKTPEGQSANEVRKYSRDQQ